MAIEAASTGFGEYDMPYSQDFENSQRIAKVQAIALSVFFGLSALSSLTLLPFSIPAIALWATAFSALSIQAALMAIGIANRAPSTQNLFPKEVLAPIPSLNKISDKTCIGFATRNGVESHQEKLNLIQQAQESILLSGCYCGGRAFNETLELIKEQMRLKSALTTSILASAIFITDENKTKIDELKEEFGDKFCCIITPEPYCYLSPTDGRFLMTLNHTKALIIDYGSAFIIGGSGIVTAWTDQLGEKDPVLAERFGFLYDAFTMKAFRDMDFVFYSTCKEGPGALLYVEMAKLFERFRYSIEGIQKSPPPPRWINISPPSASKVNGLKITCFTSGPETGKTPFLDEMIKQINGAKKSIAIDHMYFHPTPKLLQALIDASNRGIQITLITNKLDTQSPNSHAGYAELSRYWAKTLFEGKEKPNIQFYEFDVPYTTLHKKVMIFDENTLLVGSSNIGEKSLESGDYEINLLIESSEFAKEVGRLVEEDLALSKKDEITEIPLLLRISSTLQTIFTPLL